MEQGRSISFSSKTTRRNPQVRGAAVMGKAEKRQRNKFDPLRQAYPIPGEPHQQIPDPISKTGGMVAFLRNYHYNATALNQYLKCPLQFYYAKVLGLSSKDEITGDIGRDDLGTFVHNILRCYFLNKRGRPLRKIDLALREMDSLVETLSQRNTVMIRPGHSAFSRGR